MKTNILRAALTAILATFAVLLSTGAASAAPTAPQEQVSQEVIYRILADGCTGVPDSGFGVDFKPVCDKHDACYAPESTTDRLVCDDVFRTDLLAACTASPTVGACNAQAEVYYRGVRALGRPFYEGSGDPA